MSNMHTTGEALVTSSSDIADTCSGRKQHQGKHGVLNGKVKSKGKQSTVANKHPTQVARRNERERNRVRQVNMGFVTLRNCVPVDGRAKKLSKVETLRQAASYIRYLKEILGTTNTSATSTSPNSSKSAHPTTSEKCQSDWLSEALEHPVSPCTSGTDLEQDQDLEEIDLDDLRPSIDASMLNGCGGSDLGIAHSLNPISTVPVSSQPVSSGLKSEFMSPNFSANTSGFVESCASPFYDSQQQNFNLNSCENRSRFYYGSGQELAFGQNRYV